MPHTSSAKKSMRQIEKRRLLNKASKKTIRLALRKVEEPEKNTPAEQIKKDAVAAVRALDKAASKRRIHPNKAARKKSQIARKLNTLAAAK